MARLIKIMGYIVIVLLICTLICGAWIGAHPEGDVHFHGVFSSISVIMALIMQVINLAKCKYCRKGNKKA